MIPLSVPHLAGNEWKYVKECLDTNWVSSAGSYVNRFERSIAAFSGSPQAVACMNGTAALHLSLRLLGVERQDYVIVPNITFVASLNAIKYLGADPILVDADALTWQMDLDLLEDFLAGRTVLDAEGNLRLQENGRRIRALMPVHVLGNLADMDQLMELARRFRLQVVEDATEALGSYWGDRHAGTFGDAGCFSFNGNKIITTGGGGAIITRDEQLARQAKHLSTQAKISPDEYIHDEIGYNYRLVNILAAIGEAQMEQLPGFLQRKKQINDFYREQLAGVGDITFQGILAGARPNYWLFTVRTQKMRALLTFLKKQGIESRPFWKPMNQLAMFQKDLYVQRENVSGALYQACLSLPCSSGLPEADLEKVVQAVRDFFSK